MEHGQKNVIKLAVAGVTLAGAVVLGATRWKASFGGGEERVRAYFYDQSEQKLYALPRDTLAPDVGIGGEAGDGVRAIVVAPRDAGDDPAGRRIAYLETYSPELHDKLAGIQAAKRAGNGAGAKGPGGDDPYVLRNTLVRREREPSWHDMTTPEARAILTEWQGWKDGAGRPLVVVTPR